MHPGMGAGGFVGGCLLEMARAVCELLWDKSGEEEIRSGVQAWVLGGMGDPRDQGSGERVPQDGGERIPWDGEELAQMQPAVLACQSKVFCVAADIPPHLPLLAAYTHTHVNYLF